jgi:hypothetical protein
MLFDRILPFPHKIIFFLLKIIFYIYKDITKKICMIDQNV